MLLSAHAIEAVPPRRPQNITVDDNDWRVIAGASRTASSTVRR
jgi:hypothetical protein